MSEILDSHNQIETDSKENNNLWTIDDFINSELDLRDDIVITSYSIHYTKLYEWL